MCFCYLRQSPFVCDVRYKQSVEEAQLSNMIYSRTFYFAHFHYSVINTWNITLYRVNKIEQRMQCEEVYALQNRVRGSCILIVWKIERFWAHSLLALWKNNRTEFQISLNIKSKEIKLSVHCRLYGFSPSEKKRFLVPRFLWCLTDPVVPGSSYSSCGS